jgi:putative transposase
MKSQRKHYSSNFKAKVVLEALKGQQTINMIAARYGVHPNQVTQWKKQLIEALPVIFLDRRGRDDNDRDQLEATLYQQIGQLKIELDWLIKKSDISLNSKRRMVEPAHLEISIQRQCELLDLARSSFYYEPAREPVAFVVDAID